MIKKFEAPSTIAMTRITFIGNVVATAVISLIGANPPVLIAANTNDTALMTS